MITKQRLEVAAAGAVVVVVVVAGLLLSAWRGFPKGVDAYQHLTRLNFVADWFPHHNWFYAWAAGMPMFDNYPGLPYVAALPFVRLFGDTATLEAMALLAMAAFGLGLYGHLRVRTGRVDIALLAAVMVVTSMAIWHFVLASGVYARVVAMGFGGLACARQRGDRGHHPGARPIRRGRDPRWAFGSGRGPAAAAT